MALKNQLLQQAETNLEKHISPSQKDAYTRIVAAGMKAAFDKTTHGALVDGLEKSKDPVHDVAVGVVGLIIILYQQSKNKMPAPAAIAAGMTMVFEGLDYLEQTGKLQVDKNVIDQATQLYLTTIMPKFGVRPQQLQGMVNKAQTAMPQLEAIHGRNR